MMIIIMMMIRYENAARSRVLNSLSVLTKSALQVTFNDHYDWSQLQISFLWTLVISVIWIYFVSIAWPADLHHHEYLAQGDHYRCSQNCVHVAALIWTIIWSSSLLNVDENISATWELWKQRAGRLLGEQNNSSNSQRSFQVMLLMMIMFLIMMTFWSWRAN